MVQLSSSTFFVVVLFIAPSFAIPLHIKQDAKPVNSQILSQRDYEYVTLDTRNPDPKFGFLKRIKKVVNPTNIHRAERIAGLFLRDNFVDIDELNSRELPEFSENFDARDLQTLEDLEARFPKFGFLKKIKKVVNSKNIHRAEKIAGLFLRDDGYDDIQLSAKDLDESINLEHFTTRDLDVMAELEARDPSFGSFFRKVRKMAKPLGKVAGVAASIMLREDVGGYNDYNARHEGSINDLD